MQSSPLLQTVFFSEIEFKNEDLDFLTLKMYLENVFQMGILKNWINLRIRNDDLTRYNHLSEDCGKRVMIKSSFLNTISEKNPV